MDSKKIRKEGESHKFMEKFLTKLKMTKHSNEEKAPEPIKMTQTSSERKPLILWDYPTINAENMMEFSDKLHQLLENLQEMKEVTFYTYDYPNQLNNKLEKEAMELRSLYRDVRAAAIDIDRLKKQRQVVKKEKCTAQKRLDKLKDEEMKELESIINIYAKPLFCKWDSIKNTQKSEVLENFLNEIMGKHTAMEILQELIKRKLSKLSKKQSNTTNPFIIKKNISSSHMGSKIKNQERTTSSWNLNEIKPTTQPNERLQKTVVERDIIRVNRRKRQRELREDRRRTIGENAAHATNPVSSEINSNGLDLQLVPIDNSMREEIDEVLPTRATTPITNTMNRSPVVNIEYTSDDDSVSLSSSDLLIENFVHNTNQEMQTDLQNEMRNVLQALFGEIRQIPQLGYNGRNRHNNSGNDLRSPRTASH